MIDDNLRARIAQTIYGDGEELAWNRAVQLADLIIWEVGLRQEVAYAWKNNQPRPTGVRYVTEWV